MSWTTYEILVRIPVEGEHVTESDVRWCVERALQDGLLETKLRRTINVRTTGRLRVLRKSRVDAAAKAPQE